VVVDHVRINKLHLARKAGSVPNIGLKLGSNGEQRTRVDPGTTQNRPDQLPDLPRRIPLIRFYVRIPLAIGIIDRSNPHSTSQSTNEIKVVPYVGTDTSFFGRFVPIKMLRYGRDQVDRSAQFIQKRA
jgi:hypothetical protein